MPQAGTGASSSRTSSSVGAVCSSCWSAFCSARVPPIRFRKNVPDTWIALELIEGKNHQVRRMTAAIGHPTLRLIRVKIGGYELGALASGSWIEVPAAGRKLIGI